MIVFATGGQRWHFNGIESNTEVMGIEWSDSAITRLFCAGGTEVKLLEQSFALRSDGFFEWAMLKVNPEFLGALDEILNRGPAG